MCSLEHAFEAQEYQLVILKRVARLDIIKCSLGLPIELTQSLVDLGINFICSRFKVEPNGRIEVPGHNDQGSLESDDGSDDLSVQVLQGEVGLNQIYHKPKGVHQAENSQ